MIIFVASSFGSNMNLLYILNFVYVVIGLLAGMYIWGTANISEILYAKLYFHLKKPKTCTLRIWLLKFNLYKVLKTNVLGIIFTCLKSIYFLTFLSAKTHYQKQSNIFIPNKRLWCYY